jgi:predicted ATPase
MRDARIADIWRHVNNPEKFENKIIDIAIDGVNGFSPLTLTPKSAITSICGKNGSGKTTLMKFLYSALKGSDHLPDEARFGKYSYEITVQSKNSSIKITQESEYNFENVHYLEPSQECTKIINYIKVTNNFDELLDGLEENLSFNSKDFKTSFNKILGKNYKKITFKEIDGAIDNDYTFPYFDVELNSGLKYSNTNMGMGELSALYIIWFLHYCEKGSFVFIEEPENYISANTQRYLMDKMAEIVDIKKLWITLSTHSEHILSKINIDSTKVLLKSTSNDITQVINPEHRERYMMALGLTPQIQGIICVEDRLAEKFVQYLLSRLCGFLLKTHKIIPIRCDSNIEKIVKHYQPQKEAPLKYIGIFDADQKEKIIKYIGNEIYVSSLPSHTAEPPEVVLWDTLINNLEKVSTALSISNDDFTEAVNEYTHVNHHDRFLKIAEEVGKSEDVLIENLLRIWSDDEKNKKLIDLFVSTLLDYNSNQELTITKIHDGYIEVKYNGSDIVISKENISNPSNRQLIDDALIKGRLYFNSTSLILHI